MSSSSSSSSNVTASSAPRDRIIVVANVHSGAGSGHEAATGLSEALAALGGTAEVWTARSTDELSKRLADAVEARPDAIAICGGDGSVNAAATALAHSGIPFGILPRGTFNDIARRHALPMEPAAVAALLRSGPVRDIGAGKVNDLWFLNNCSFGLYTDVIEARERHTARWGRMRVVAVASALNTALRPRARLPLRVLDQHGTSLFAGRASLVFVGVNPLQFERSGLPLLASQVEAGALGAVLVRAISPWRLVPILFGAATRRLAVLDEIEPAAMPSLCIELRRGHVDVVFDGERCRLTSPLRFSYEPDVLRLIAPRPVAAGGGGVGEDTSATGGG